VSSFPERTDVHRAVQFEQRFFHRPIDHRLLLLSKPAFSPHVPPSPRTLKKDHVRRRNVQQIDEQK
jgi:hypothetical protein